MLAYDTNLVPLRIAMTPWLKARQTIVGVERHSVLPAFEVCRDLDSLLPAPLPLMHSKPFLSLSLSNPTRLGVARLGCKEAGLNYSLVVRFSG